MNQPNALALAAKLTPRHRPHSLKHLPPISKDTGILIHSRDEPVIVHATLQIPHKHVPGHGIPDARLRRIVAPRMEGL